MLRFRLTDRAVLVLQRGDLTKWSGDAIVNAANERMLGGGGVDGGPELLAACKQVEEVAPGVRCPTGEARITPGFGLPAKHVIHTVGPIYRSASASEPLLSSAYRRSLQLANDHGLASVAFPAISCGVYGYPYDEAAEVAVRSVGEAADGVGEVHFVLFEQPAWDAWAHAAGSALEALPNGGSNGEAASQKDEL